MTTPRTQFAALAALAVTACGLTACSGSTVPEPAAQPTAEPTAQPDPVTLRLGTDDESDTPGAEQIEHFAKEVARLSDGALAVEPVWHAGGDQPHWDQHIAQMVVDGELDLGMVPARAWDDLGVSTLTALNTPFLITTDTLTEAVVTDDDLVEQLTSGLPDAGVAALGLFPEGMRHPFGFHGPLTGPGDYAGGVVRSPYSRTTEAVFEALGATMSDEDADPTTMAGAESSYRLTPAGEATGNVVFYPKVNSLVIDADVQEQLSEDQLGVLRAAADSTQDWVLENLPSDAEFASTFCEQAGKIGAASPRDLDALVAATRGVVDDLRRDPTSAAIIDRIEALAADDPVAEPVTACPDGTAADTSLVDGTYTVTVTEEQLRANGATDQELIDENAGDYVVTFEQGTWTMEQQYTSGPNAGTLWHGSGGFLLDGAHLNFVRSQNPGDDVEMDVEVGDDGSLVFSDVQDVDAVDGQPISEALFSTWSLAAS